MCWPKHGWPYDECPPVDQRFMLAVGDSFARIDDCNHRHAAEGELGVEDFSADGFVDGFVH
jgi:hypothetical protein